MNTDEVPLSLHMRDENNLKFTKIALMPCISNFSDQILEEPPLRHALQP